MTDIPVKPPFEIEELITEDMLKFHQKSAVCVLRCLTEYYKDRLNSEVYDELINYYSMSESERAEYKSQKRQERAHKKALKRKEKRELQEQINEKRREIGRNNRAVLNSVERKKSNAKLEEEISALEIQIVNL
jgi:hypothetical protein